MANADDAADRAAAQAEKLTGGLFKGIKPKVPETDGGTWWERLSVGQSIVMLVSGLNLLFGLFGLFWLFGLLGWIGGIINLIFALVSLLIVAFIFYSTFEVRRVRRRSFASLQIVLAALLFALGLLRAIVETIIPSPFFYIGYSGFGFVGAFIGIFWYGAIVGGAILTMSNPQLTLNNLFGGSGATVTASAGQTTQPAPPPPGGKPHIPAANIYVSKAGATMGPFDRATFDTKIATGEISRDDLVYADNNQWIPIKDCL